MLVRDLETPCLVLDRPSFERNLVAMETAVRAAGKRLRPHAKTHKCSRIARAQLEAGAVGICAAKASEALALLAAGVEPVLITGPVVSSARLDALAAAAAEGKRVSLVVDSPEGARWLETALAALGARMPVLIDLDPGLGRTGVSAEAAPALARVIEGHPHLDLVGVQAYLGSAQHVRLHAQRREISLAAMRAAQSVYRALRAAGHCMEIFTGAGTGTFDIDVEVEDITDLQAGSYALMDTQYLAVGSRVDVTAFGTFDPALRVHTTVLSAPIPGRVTVDAGLKSIYRDEPPPVVLSPGAGGLSYDWFGDEYGKITVGDGVAPAIGDRLVLIPSHCDPTVNLHDRIHVVDGEQVVDVWPVDLRGLSQ